MIIYQYDIKIPEKVVMGKGDFLILYEKEVE